MKDQQLLELGRDAINLVSLELGDFDPISDSIGDGSVMFQVNVDSEPMEFALTFAGTLPQFGPMVAINLNGEKEPIVEADYRAVAAIIAGWFHGMFG